MMNNPGLAALAYALSACAQHVDALHDALGDLGQSRLDAVDLERLSKEERRLLDQFAYRYTRLQDDMGARLFPAALRALGEDVGPMPMLDRLARLEQLGWLQSAEEWLELRRIRNEFTHEYPEEAEERILRLKLAVQSARLAISIYENLRARALDRFPNLAAS